MKNWVHQRVVCFVQGRCAVGITSNSHWLLEVPHPVTKCVDRLVVLLDPSQGVYVQGSEMGPGRLRSRLLRGFKRKK